MNIQLQLVFLFMSFRSILIESRYMLKPYYDNLKDTNSYNLYQFSLTECVPRILPCTRKEIYFYVLYIF